MMPRVLRRLLVALATTAGVLLVVVIAWGLDLRAHDGEVVRNTELGGRPIGGMTQVEVAQVVGDVAEEFEGAAIRVAAEGGGFATDASTLGVTVAEPATIDTAFDVGRGGNVVSRLAGWVRSLFVERDAALRVRVDVAAVYRTVRDEDPGRREEPKEPRIVLRDGRLTAVEGESGRGIDAADVIDALPDVAARGEPFVVEVERGDVEPRWTTEHVQALIDQARELVDEPLRVSAGDASARIPAATARSWLRSEATDDGLRLTVSEDAALASLATALDEAGTPATETRFTVEGGNVRIIAGERGTKCCDARAADVVERALLEEGDPGASVDLPLTARDPTLTEEEARELRIVEPVGSFRTTHRAGEPRVANIHRIADIVRGQVIMPGGSFSVNTTVGRRTQDKGFVAAPVIEEGKFSEDVGGGISQFATTMFNAAFFAGLEFGEYQSHSIYISRYPYGREATLSYPHPDLIVENPSPHGVLIWPTYTNDSITVTLYSTKWAEATQTGQSRAPRGACTRVTTERTRRWVEDGRSEVDRVFATYRPAEGVNC
jgi:vancomycin resistance protein YoaR